MAITSLTLIKKVNLAKCCVQTDNLTFSTAYYITKQVLDAVRLKFSNAEDYILFNCIINHYQDCPQITKYFKM